jgi:hypothetical protein
MQRQNNPNLIILELAVSALDVRNADEVVKNAIEEQFSVLIKNERFLEAIPGHLPSDAASQARLPLIMERVDALANLAN